MGKVGRFACIFVPLACTLASLICLIIVFMAGLNKSSTTLSNLYFFKADTSNFTTNVKTDLIKGTDIDDKLLSALKGASANSDLKDFYQVYLWNYCSGDIDASTHKQTITYCSPRKANFWFNPVDVWGLNGTAAENLFPEQLAKGLDVYQKVARWMFVAYVIAIAVTAGEIVIGGLAICSRWGSCLTTIVSSASTLFTIAASATATALYLTLTGTANATLRAYGIKSSVGSSMLGVTWLAAAFSLVAGVFWLASMCCCSGKSDKKKVVVEKTPYTYERVGSPAFGHQQGGQVPLKDIRSGHAGSAYEPFRHDRV